MPTRSYAKPKNVRPYRSLTIPGDEVTAVVTGQDERKTRNTYRQVGWIGQTGAFYALGEKPAETEPGSFAPLWFVAFSDRLDEEGNPV